MRTTDVGLVDTSPGGASAFSPPADFAGGEDEYGAWLSQKFSRDPGFAQLMAVLTRYLFTVSGGFTPQIVGVYAERLRAACAKYNGYCKTQAAREASINA